MRAIGVTVACVAALAMSGCAAGNGPLSDADRTAIRAADALYVKADDARDVDTMMQLIGEGVVYMPPGSQPLVGREAVRSLFKLHPWDKLTETPAEIEGRPDFAMVRGSYAATAQGKSSAGYYIEIWQKQTDGAWKITRKVWNTNTP